MTTYYSTDHEWITVDGEIATIGITAHAAELLGDIVFVEQKEIGDAFEKGEEMGVVESVKAASDILAPISGEISEINEALEETPTLINESPESDAWIYKIKIADADQLGELMDLNAYKTLIG